jgi:asparagine synthase (glutamine-hydrolysing)
VTGIEMPIFPKRRFQQGVAAAETATRLFPRDEARYRSRFQELYAGG